MGIKKFYRPILGYDGQMIDGGNGGAVDSVNGQTGTVVLDIPTLDFATISAIEGDWRGEGVETLLAALTALQGT